MRRAEKLFETIVARWIRLNENAVTVERLDGNALIRDAICR